MKIYSVYDPLFQRYGQILEEYDCAELMSELAETPIPDEGTGYVMSDEKLEALPVAEELRQRAFGGMPIQLGYCNGWNTRLNCLEYHRDSEINLGTEEFILLLAKREEMEDGRIHSRQVRAFRIPAGVLIEIYATTLHFAPCQASPFRPVQVLVVLPRGTNGPKPSILPQNDEDRLLWARNKWLLGHADSKQAGFGACVRIDGENIDIKKEIR